MHNRCPMATPQCAEHLGSRCSRRTACNRSHTTPPCAPYLRITTVVPTRLTLTPHPYDGPLSASAALLPQPNANPVQVHPPAVATPIVTAASANKRLVCACVPTIANGMPTAYVQGTTALNPRIVDAYFYSMQVPAMDQKHLTCLILDKHLHSHHWGY